MPSPSATAVDEIVKLVAKQTIRPAGFRGSGRRFHRAQGSLFSALCFQGSQWNSCDRASFTLNVRIVLPLFHRAWSRKAMPKNPASAVAVVNARIGLLMPDERDLWWETSSSNASASLAQEVCGAIEVYALPFLSPIASEEALLEFLRTRATRRLCHYEPKLLEAVVLRQLQRSAESKLLLEQLKANAKPESFRETLQRLSATLEEIAA